MGSSAWIHDHTARHRRRRTHAQMDSERLYYVFCYMKEGAEHPVDIYYAHHKDVSHALVEQCVELCAQGLRKQIDPHLHDDVVNTLEEKWQTIDHNRMRDFAHPLGELHILQYFRYHDLAEPGRYHDLDEP